MYALRQVHLTGSEKGSAVIQPARTQFVVIEMFSRAWHRTATESPAARIPMHAKAGIGRAWTAHLEV
jgi:hypothetical protein